MTAKPKTFICDIDGTIIVHQPDAKTQITEAMEILPNVIKTFNKWRSQGHIIILMTARSENLRTITEMNLRKIGIKYDQLVMNVSGGKRILINDLKPDKNDINNPTAIAINLLRNEGFNGI